MVSILLTLQPEITCFQVLRRTKDNENIYHAKFDWYTERSSWADINPKSYHLTAFVLVNPLQDV